MSLLDFFRPSVRREDAVTSLLLPPGPRTAHDAFALAEKTARQYDAGYRLTFVASGSDLDAQGRSRTWRFSFHLPDREESLEVTLEPDRKRAEETGECPPRLTSQLRPAEALRRGRNAPPALPVPFRDSPEVVASFAAQGMDFLSRGTDRSIESRWGADGRPLWRTFSGARERAVAFQSVGEALS